MLSLVPAIGKHIANLAIFIKIREIFLNQRGNQRVTASTVFRFVLITPSGAVRRHLRKLKAATPTRAIIATRMPPRIMTIHLMNLRIPASVSLLRATVA